MRKKALLFIILILLISSFMPLNMVNANEQTLNSEIEVETQIVNQKQEVSILLKLSNTEEINTYQAKINYDENIWENLTESNFTVKGNWQELKYNKENKNFIVINKEGITENDILEIKLISKENIESKTTTISIENIIASDGNTEFVKDSIEHKIEIKLNNSNKDQQENQDQQENPKEKPQDQQENQNQQENPKEKPQDQQENQNQQENPKEKPQDQQENQVQQENQKENTQEQDEEKTNKNVEEKQKEQEENLNKLTIKKQETENSINSTPLKVLPKTGKSNIIPILITIVLILIIIILCKYKKLKNTILLFLIGIITLTNSNIASTSTNIFLGDINKSSVIDDEDIKLLEEHLINLKSLEQESQADMNEDSKITIIDLSLLIKQQKECPYDKYNVTNISKWETIPMVSKELLEKDEITTGGEGCQWPIGMAINKNGNLLLMGTDVGGIYRSEDGGKNWQQSNAGLTSRGAGAFAIDPKNSNYVIEIGINSNSFDTNGPHISEDGGKT